MRILLKSFIIGTGISLLGQSIGLGPYEILIICALAGATLGVWEATRERDS